MVKILDKCTLPMVTASRAENSGIEENNPLTLDALRTGQKGIISHISDEAGLKMRLLELGFVAGSPVAFLMSTPFGDPGIYSLRGTSIALRKNEARCIRVNTAKI
jgi:Fe2+ transport system protein FeoA